VQKRSQRLLGVGDGQVLEVIVRVGVRLNTIRLESASLTLRGCNIATGGQRSMRKPRRNHSPAFKARVALEAIRGEKTIAEIAAHHEVHVTQVTAWKTELLENAAAIFGGDMQAADSKERIRDLQAKIGELTMENSFLEGALGKFPGPSGKR
jgi:transposase-like protein